MIIRMFIDNAGKRKKEKKQIAEKPAMAAEAAAAADGEIQTAGAAEGGINNGIFNTADNVICHSSDDSRFGRYFC